jgi:hypothetical protein
VLLGYCTVANLKAVLQISEDKFDSELSECISSASGLVDGYLACERLTVPSVVVPQVLADATKYFAAWDFRRRRDPVGAEAFWTEATRILGVYLDAEKAPYVGSV